MSLLRNSRSRLRRSLAAAAAIAGLSALALTGCSAGGSTSGTTELSFFSWDNEAVMTPIIAAFEKENPTIKIKFSTSPPVAEYISTLQTRLLSGTAADVFIIAAENKTNLINGQYAEDLTDKPYLSVASKFNTATYSADGKAYGLSIGSWAGGLLYNEDLLAQVGVTTPPTTWDDFLDLCAKLKDAGITPLYDGAGGGSNIVSALIGLANKNDGGDVDARIFSGKETFEDFYTAPLTTWNDLFTKGLVSPDVVGLTGDQTVDEFVNGRVAMIGAGPWNIPSIREKAPDLKINFMAIPTPSGDTYWAGAASPGFAINTATKHQEAADKFLAFMASKEGVELYNKYAGTITTTSNFTPVIDPALDANLKGLIAGDFYLPQIAWPEYQDALNTEFVAQIQLLIQGQIKPADVGVALDKKLKEEQG